MKQSTPNSAVPAAIVRKLQLVQKRSLFVQVACALVASAAVLVAAMGVAMLIDWLATLYDSRWRVVLTMLAVAAAAATSIGWIAVAWRRALRLERAAADVDRQIPQLEERWTTVTRLGDDAAKPEVVHPAMLRRLSSEAASWEPRIEPEQVVSMSSLVRAMLALTAVTAVLAIAVVLDSREVVVLVKRFWLPGASISATKLVDVNGNMTIARGEPLALNASIDGRAVKSAVLFVQPQSKPEQQITLVAERTSPVGFSHRMRSVDEPFAYRFRAGDGQTEWFNVDLADRPEIDAIKLTVTPPAYTRQKPKIFDHLPDRLSAMRTSRIEVAIRAKAPVETAQLKTDNNQTITLPLSADGWYRWTTKLGDSCSITPVLTEQHGLTNRRQPKCQLICYEDQPPVVKVLTPSDRVAVRPDDAIQITFSATDDVGIGSAELVVYNENAEQGPKELAAIPIDLGDQQGARAVQQTVGLDLKKFGTNDGAELSYEIRVREDRGGEPRIASRPSTSKAGTRQQKSVAANDMKNQPGGKQPNGQNTGPANAQNSVAGANTASDNTVQPQNGQTASSAAAQNNASQPQPASSTSNSPAAPSPTTQEANDKTAPGRPSASEQVKSTTQPATPSPTQPPRAASAPNRKDVSSSNPASTSKAGPSASMPAPQATSSATSNPPPLASNPNPAGSQPQNPQPASASPTPNSSPANSATTAANQQPSANSQAPSSQAANSQPPATSTAQMPKSDSAKSGASPNKDSMQPPAPRIATSGRKSLTADGSPSPASDQTAPNQSAAAQPSNPSQNSSSSAAASSTNRQKPSGDQKPSPDKAAMASNDKSKREPANSANQPSSQFGSRLQAKSSSDPSQSDAQSSSSPGNNMPTRTLDIPQQSSSQRMRLKVDQWAGSFEGQQREKLEMAIAPELEALDEQLAKAQRTSRGVLDGLEATHTWAPTNNREIASAQQHVVDGKKIIESLVKRSKDTPYAFIGLQVSDLDVAHLEPARSDFWSSLQSKGDDRTASVRDGWQHIGRARQLLADLRGQFERSRRDFKLAESVQRAKKMYQVYVENTNALLDVKDDDPERYARKLAEFNLDEEYLKRLKEVLKMRQDLQAELARILGDDPRLLRRFMDSLRAKSKNLREQLADLSAGQEGLNREVRAWTALPETDRQPMARLLLMQHLQEASKLATSAGELQDRYQSWLPLQKETKDSALAAVSKQVQEAATAAGELRSHAEAYNAAEQQAAAAPPAAPPAPAPGTDATAATANPQPPADNSQALDAIIGESEALYRQLSQLEVSLRQLAFREDNPEVATFAGNRLTQTRQLIAESSAWVRQMKAHKAGKYTGAAEVSQYRLAMKTDEIAGKLSEIERVLAVQLQRPDGKLPEPIALKAREFMAALDKEAAPNQLAAVYALHSNQLPRATERQQVAGTALANSEKLYDELMRMVITELDKLPVQDPIASLLDDPTLDELLAQLEQELPLQELLGIPNRPSNLQIIGDWIRPNAKGSGGGGGGRQIMANQMRQQDKRSQQKLDQAYQKAIARALKEAIPKRTEKITKSAKLSDWNKLVSHLGDDLNQGRDKAPPEQYRQAIEQYFAQISRAVAEQEKKSP
jgi:hypothetical protein